MNLKLVEGIGVNQEEEADARKTIENAIDERIQDDRFDGSKEIVRDLYVMPPDQVGLSKEEIEELQVNDGNMKVYPFHGSCKVEIPPPYSSFEQAFGNNANLMREFEKNNFDKPTPIQAQMWPILLSGKDCIGVSQTGSGKTLAFLLPAFLHIEAQLKQYQQNESKPSPFVLILSPTRELAQQIDSEVKKYSYNGYRSVCLYGGGSRREQISLCENGVEIVIATPGRLSDLSDAGVIKLGSVSYVVLDEADRMLDMGFEASIRRILFDIRPDRLVALTSATWPESVRKLTDRYTKEGIMVVNGTLDLTACKNVVQHFEFVHPNDRFDRIVEIVHFLDNAHGSNYKLIIFVKSKVMADHMSSNFCIKGINSQGLHGGRSQTDREQSLKSLRNGDVKILVATDLASRGIDVPDITHVINYDFPTDIEEYVHRVGRTGRAGRFGEALSFLWKFDRSNYEPLIALLESSGQEVPKRLRYECEKYKENVRLGIDGPRPPFRRQGNNNMKY